MNTSAMTGARKAAILFVLLGEEVASVLCRQLPPEAVEQITQEIASSETIPPEAAAQVLEECYQMMTARQDGEKGGSAYAGRVLAKAFGEERAKNLLSRITPPEQSVASFTSLQKADPQQIVKFIESEHPQTIALILAHLGPKAAPALLLLPEQVRAEAVRRLAGLNQFAPEAVHKILQVLDRKLKNLGEKQDRRAYGGAKAVADLLNKLDAQTSKAILDTVEQADPKQAIEIRNSMFTFEDLLTVPENGIRELLSQLDKKTLATALKGASEEVKSHIFKCMSSRAVDMLKEDMEALGPVRVRDVDRAKQEAVELLRKIEASGKIVLKTEGDEYVV